MRLLTYAPIPSFTNPPVTLPKISLSFFFFFPFIIIIIIIIILFYFIFLTLGCIADSNASVLDFETSIKVRSLVHAARRHVFRSDFTLKHYTVNSYVFYFPIPLPPRQEHVKQFHSPPVTVAARCSGDYPKENGNK